MNTKLDFPVYLQIRGEKIAIITIQMAPRRNKQQRILWRLEILQWKPQPLHVNMDKYFLLGKDDVRNTVVFEDGDVRNDLVIDDNTSNGLCINYDNIWRPDSSISKQFISEEDISTGEPKIDSPQPLQSFSQLELLSGYSYQNYLEDSLDMTEPILINENEDRNIPEPIVTAPSPQSSSSSLGTGEYYLEESLHDGKTYNLPPVRNIAVSPKPNPNYDFMQALPPLSKGDNHDKVHRSSTSLSISVLPIDIWADSDISLPVSRRSSNLCSSVTTSRKVSSNFESLTEQSVESVDDVTTLNFTKLNLLAEEVIARRSEGSANSTDDCDEKEGLSADNMKCNDDRQFEGDMSIEDNDAGSGLTTSEESDG